MNVHRERWRPKLPTEEKENMDKSKTPAFFSRKNIWMWVSCFVGAAIALVAFNYLAAMNNQVTVDPLVRGAVSGTITIQEWLWKDEWGEDMPLGVGVDMQKNVVSGFAMADGLQIVKSDPLLKRSYLGYTIASRLNGQPKEIRIITTIRMWFPPLFPPMQWGLIDVGVRVGDLVVIEIGPPAKPVGSSPKLRDEYLALPSSLQEDTILFIRAERIKKLGWSRLMRGASSAP